jgi:uncharacterized protein
LVEYVAFAVWCFLVALAGGLVGLVLGNIRLPATLLVASPPAAGTGANLVISAISAATASIAHIRAGRINWRLFWWMAPPSIVGALVGGYLSGAMPQGLLLGFISAVLFYSAFDLWRWKPKPRPTASGADVPPDAHLDIRAAVATGLIIGLLGGIVGLILGSLRMPALLKFVGEIPARAVGTNVSVGFVVGVAGALGHLPTAEPDWTAAAIGAAASSPGALLGSRLTGRLSEQELVRAIAGVLLIAAIACTVQALA